MNFGHMSVRPSRSLSYGRAVILLLGRSRDAKAKDLDSFAGAMRRSANFPFIPFACHCFSSRVTLAAAEALSSKHAVFIFYLMRVSFRSNLRDCGMWDEKL